MHHEGGCINDILPCVVMTLFVFPGEELCTMKGSVS